MKKNFLFISFILLISFNVIIANSQEPVGKVINVDFKKKEIYVSNPKTRPFKMGEKLYIHIDSFTISLDVSYPMMTFSKCILQGNQDEFFNKIIIGMDVYNEILLNEENDDKKNEEKIIIKYSTFFPPTHINAIISDEWCKEVENRTAGRIKTTHYTGGTVTPAPQIYDSIVQGIADVGNTVLSYTLNKFPLSQILDYPLGYGSGSAVASNLANEYFKKFNPKEFNDVKVMYFHSHSWGILHTNKPVNKLEDLEGIKIRAASYNAEFTNLLGGIPVSMTMAETYNALSKGSVDGIFAVYEAIKGWKFGEVINYSIENTATAYTMTFIVAMNKEKWASISSKDQKTIEAINAEYIKKQAAIWDDINNEGKAFMLQRGNTIIKLSAQEQARWVAAAQPLYAKYVSKMKEMNLPGDQVLKFVQDYLNKYSKK